MGVGAEVGINELRLRAERRNMFHTHARTRTRALREIGVLYYLVL